MQWPEDPANQQRPNLTYRCMRVVAREVVQVWFREVDVVDNENIPSEGGAVFIAWHPSGLIDPMLMMASLPGKMSLIAKHTLFKMPILGAMMRASGALPIMRSSDVKGGESDSKKHNKDLLSSVSEAVARGGKLIIFPEGTTHSESDVKRVRTGAARIMEMAIEQSEDEGLPPPSLIPVGLHYSEAHTFRERAAVIVERPMELPPLPERSDDAEADETERRTWVKEVTSDIEKELKRASHSASSWQNRHLIWRARSIVHAERSRASDDKISKPTYAESVLGARRLRAGWEYLAKHDSERTTKIVTRATAHFENLDKLGLHPLDIDAKPEELTTKKYIANNIRWLWSVCWMLGIVTWGAILGTLPPYYANRLLTNLAIRKNASQAALGTIKVYSSILLFPIWWAIITVITIWLLLGDESIVRELFTSHWLLVYLTKVPLIVVGMILIIFWPLTGRAHLVLQAKASRSWRVIKRWKRWNDDSIEWDDLRSEQLVIARTLTSLGDEMVLPGDADWQSPPLGTDDAEAVRMR